MIRASQVSLTVLLVVLAGCSAGGGDEETDGSTVTVKSTGAAGRNAGATDGNAGATNGNDDAESATLTGVVLDDEGFTIFQALVTVFSVSNSVETSRNGTFQFDSIAAGKQTIRVEKQGYETVAEEIQLKAGSVTDIEVILVPLDKLQPGFRNDHDHGELWHGSDRYTFFDGDLEWHTSDDLPPEECLYGLAQQGDWCDRLYVPAEKGKLIPPGARALEITLTWEPEVDDSKPTFGARPPTEPHDNTYYTIEQMESGETYELEIDPLYADHGHNSRTEWVIWIGRGDFPMPKGSTYNSMREGIGVSIVALKGEVPIDPPHPRYWAETDSIVLPKVEEDIQALVRAPQRNPVADRCNYFNLACLKFDEGGIVPPGTTRLDVNFSYHRPGGLLPDEAPEPLVYDYVLGFKGSARPRTDATWEDYDFPEPAMEEPHSDGNGRTLQYSIDVSDHGADQFYNKRSKWVFMVTAEDMHDADELEMCQTYACGRYIFTIEAVAVNENRDKQIEAGTA